MRTTLISIAIYSQEEAERFSSDELLVVWANQSNIAEKIAAAGYNVPVELQKSLKTLKRQLDFKLEADLERELENIDSRIEAGKSQAEKAAALNSRRDEILEKLGRKPRTASA